MTDISLCKNYQYVWGRGRRLGMGGFGARGVGAGRGLSENFQNWVQLMDGCL